MGVKWIKLCTDIFDDEKILLIEGMPEADAIIVIWFKLLCMAGKQNNSGVFMMNDKIAYTDEMLATIFRRPLNIVRLALKTFEQFGMVEVVEGAITIPNWNKHQNIEQIESRKEYMREYMKNYRNQKALPDVNECKHLRKPNVSTIEKEKERDIDIKKESNTCVLPKKKESVNRFQPPTVEEVSAYCEERNNNVDAQRFVDYYTSNGWKVGKNAMKDWKAAVRTWERADTPKPIVDDDDMGYNGINYFKRIAEKLNRREQGYDSECIDQYDGNNVSYIPLDV